MSDKVVEKVSKKYPSKPRKRAKSYYESPYSDAATLNGWRTFDRDEHYGDTLAKDLLEWIRDPEGVDIIEFLIYYGLASQVYYRMKNEYPVIQEAHDYATMVFGSRREKSARNRSEDSKVIMRTLHKYHPTWKKVTDEEIDLKRELSAMREDKKPTEITVVMDSFSDNDEEDGHESVEMA